MIKGYRNKMMTSYQDTSCIPRAECKGSVSPFPYTQPDQKEIALDKKRNGKFLQKDKSQK